jgi:hypothetical protein
MQGKNSPDYTPSRTFVQDEMCYKPDDGLSTLSDKQKIRYNGTEVSLWPPSYSTV